MPHAPEPDRPYMPGYGLEQATSAPGERLPWERVQQLLEEARNYWVVTVRPDGRPHAMPVWGLWLDGAIYFSTGRRSRKARNFAANPEVVVHLESGDPAVIIEGTVAEVTDAGTLRHFAEVYERKYNWRVAEGEPGSPSWQQMLRGSGIYVVRPRVLFAFGEGLADTATRWRFR